MSRRLLLCLILLLSPWSLASLPEGRHLAVSAEGEVEAVADIVELTLVVAQTRDQAVDAKREVDRITAAIIRAARDKEIADRYIRAAQISVAPEYEWQEGRRVLLGQRVERRIELRVEDLDQYGPLVDAVIEAGVSRIAEARFDLSRRQALEQQAMDKAITRAREKAAAMAAAFDSRLGPVYSVREDEAAAAPEFRAMRAEAEDGAAMAPMLPGTEKIRRRVHAVFYLR